MDTHKGDIQSQTNKKINKKKKKNHHLILHIRISLGSKFQVQ